MRILLKVSLAIESPKLKLRGSVQTWCLNNGLGDARRKNGIKKAVKRKASGQGKTSVIFGCITWSIALEFVLKGFNPPVVLLICCIISYILNRFFRDKAFIVNCILPGIIWSLLTGVF